MKILCSRRYQIWCHLVSKSRLVSIVGVKSAEMLLQTTQKSKKRITKPSKTMILWLFLLVAGEGLEPPTSGLWARRATNCSIPRYCVLPELVPVTGLEPVRYCYREILSLLCLPFHHTGGYWQGLEYHTLPIPSTLFQKFFLLSAIFFRQERRGPCGPLLLSDYQVCV